MNKIYIFAFLLSVLLVSLVPPLAGLGFAFPAPAGLSVSYSPKKNSTALSWRAVPGATGFNIYRKDLNDAGFTRINFSPVTMLSYEDRGLVKDKDYLYAVRSLDAAGIESADSESVGAPLMNIDVKAQIVTIRDKPLSALSKKSGRLVTFAAPGDIITYSISYKNQGVSSAKNISINYDIPQGTFIAGSPLIKEGPEVQTSYFDKFQQKWIPDISSSVSISRVRFNIPGPLAPLSGSKKVNGIIDLNVVIEQ